MRSPSLAIALMLVDTSMSLVTPASIEGALASRLKTTRLQICDQSRDAPRPVATMRSRCFLQRRKYIIARPVLAASALYASIRGGAGIASNDKSSPDENLQGVMLMALSALSFSLMFLGVKLYSEAPTFTLVFYRSVVQTILSLMVLRRDRRTNPLGPSDFRKALILRGTCGSLAVAAFFFAIQGLPLPDAITLQFTTPVFAALMAVPLLGESWSRSDQIGASVCLAGVMLIARPSWIFGTHSIVEGASNVALVSTTLPTVIGLIGAVLAALAYVLVRRIGKRVDANVMVFYYAVISGLTAPFGSKLLGGNSSWDVLGNPTPTELVVFACLGVFGFLGQLMTNQGLTKCKSTATATLVSNSQIIFAFLFEILILHESISLWSLAGTALIVGYMVFTGVSNMQGDTKIEEAKK